MQRGTEFNSHWCVLQCDRSTVTLSRGMGSNAYGLVNRRRAYQAHIADFPAIGNTTLTNLPRLTISL